MRVFIRGFRRPFFGFLVESELGGEELMRLVYAVALCYL